MPKPVLDSVYPERVIGGTTSWSLSLGILSITSKNLSSVQGLVFSNGTLPPQNWLDAKITISDDAEPGLRDVILTDTSGNSGSLLPVLTSYSPGEILSRSPKRS
jgi:hypothetical protein